MSDVAITITQPTTNSVTIAAVGPQGATGATGSTTASLVTVANEATDTTCFLVFATASGSGDLALKTNTGLTFNSATVSLGATTFVGALTGNASTVTTNANLTGHVTSVGNAAVLGSFTKAQLDAAVSDDNVAYLGQANTFVGNQVVTGALTGDQASGTNPDVDTTANRQFRLQTGGTTWAYFSKWGATTGSMRATVGDLHLGGAGLIYYNGSGGSNLYLGSNTGFIMDNGVGYEFVMNGSTAYFRNGTVDAIKMILQGVAGQTADYLRCQTSAAAVEFKVAQGGNVTASGTGLFGNSSVYPASIGGDSGMGPWIKLNCNGTYAGFASGSPNVVFPCNNTAYTNGVLSLGRADYRFGGLFSTTVDTGTITASGTVTASSTGTHTFGTTNTVTMAGSTLTVTDNASVSTPSTITMNSWGTNGSWRMESNYNSAAPSWMLMSNNTSYQPIIARSSGLLELSNSTVTISSAGTVTASGDITISKGNPKLTLTTSTNSTPAIDFVNSSKTFRWNMNSSGDFQLTDVTSGPTRIFIKPDGKVGIGDYYGASNYPQASFSVVGSVSIGFSTAASVTVPSSGLIVNGAVSSVSPTEGIGYATGAGGAVTQVTSRTTGVTINKVTGSITLVSAAGSATAASLTVTNSAVAATDTIYFSQKSGTDLYSLLVTAVSNGSFVLTFFTTGGTTTEQPVFNFTILKGVAS